MRHYAASVGIPSGLCFAARLRDSTRLTGLAVHTVTGAGPAAHSAFPGQQHRPAVDARRLASGVDLRDPPHTQQCVGAGPEHQLLQVADLLQVPCLRCREDPLPQTPYVLLDLPPVHSVPVQVALGSVRHSVRHGRSRSPSWRPTCPSVPMLSFIKSSQAHLTRVSALSGPVIKTRIRAVIRHRRREAAIRAGFPLPFGVPAFASRVILFPLGN